MRFVAALLLTVTLLCGLTAQGMAKDKFILPTTQQECEAKGGKWERNITSPDAMLCYVKAPDAGTECHKADECDTHHCLAVNGADKAGACGAAFLMLNPALNKDGTYTGEFDKAGHYVDPHALPVP